MKAPDLVQQVDMASAWPDERKQRVVSIIILFSALRHFTIFKNNFQIELETEGDITIYNFDNKYPSVEK